jgi:hypothetical protein
MIYVVCNVLTGELLGVSEEFIEVSGAPLQGMSFDRGLPDFSREEWNRGLRAFVLKTHRVVSKLEFLDKFTQAERISIKQARGVSPALDDYLYLLELAQEVNLDSNNTRSGVNMLEQAGLLGVGRAAEILA